MTTQGIGFCPFGTTPAGYGIPDEASIPKRVVLKDDFGNRGSCRFIDPVTRDYTFNSDGLIVGGSGMQQLVYLRLFTVKGSSVFPNMGQEFSKIKTISEKTTKQIDSLIRESLSDLVNNNKVHINNISVVRPSNNQTRLSIKVEWSDLERNTNQVNII